MRFSLLLIGIVCLSACGPGDTSSSSDHNEMAATISVPEQGSIDSDSGLIVDENWQVVQAHCGVCHSTRLVTQNRGNRETWLSLIRWMQETQGLWEFDPATEDRILTYLATNYPPLISARRAPLAPDLLPPSPHTSSTN